ncbi:MAG TPA: magnesium-translocating P-type ATPase [Chthonomonadaceae bacterium]|nr:magnesium-translocating P-type ATPase [Chthonomonadaceae bacterium]
MERPAFWNVTAAELLPRLQTTPQGLSDAEARQRLARSGANLLKRKTRTDAVTLLLAQFKSPILLILLAAATLSFFLGDHADTLIILVIVLASGLLGFWQERGAADAVEKLLAIVQIEARVVREGKERDIPVEEVVPGDIVLLNAGDVIPGDCLILESKDLFVNEAALTGETYPVEKSTGVLPPETPLSQRTNTLFMGTHVVNGTARAVVVHTGKETEFGAVSEQLKLRPPETDFERGIRRFGYFLMEVTLLLVLSIFAFNVYLHRPVLDSFLFALALAVGLTPQLLPAIISVNLAHGARRMAAEKVIVKRLAAIENFGSMNILCSDKTGTLTEGTVQLHAALDAEGKESAKVLRFAYLNASLQTGYTNPIDDAICARFREMKTEADVAGCAKLDEEPYDFVRKRLSVLYSEDSTHRMVTKGALANVLEVCTQAETSTGERIDIETMREAIQKRYEELSAQGFRTLGIAYRDCGSDTRIGKDDEAELIFLGFLVLFDPLRPGIVDTLKRLRGLGITLKVITGDNRLVAANVGRQAGISNPEALSGPELRRMSTEALTRRVNQVDVFAEVEPNQKERLILALKQAGHVVGYIGDGINDASALHAADVSLSVANAVDVAKEAADIVLLEKDLAVLERGVREGRTTFANTLKYIFMATSANFGNMFSMAGASLFLPFLPLLPKQILLTNLLTDFPEMTIATDDVDQELVERPRRWDIRFIRRFMMTFGLVSSLFDYLTFGALLFLLHATPTQFRTGWFLESVISAASIVLVIRTRRPFFRSRPGAHLRAATLLIVALTAALPFTPLAGLFGFTPLPLPFLLVLALIVLLYMAMAEIVKRLFYRRERG